MSAAEAGRCPPLELVPRLVRAMMVKVLLPASNAPRVGRRQVYGTGRGGAFVSFSTSFNIFNPSVLRVVMGLVGNGNIKVKRSKGSFEVEKRKSETAKVVWFCETAIVPHATKSESERIT